MSAIHFQNPRKHKASIDSDHHRLLNIASHQSRKFRGFQLCFSFYYNHMILRGVECTEDHVPDIDKKICALKRRKPFPTRQCLRVGGHQESMKIDDEIGGGVAVGRLRFLYSCGVDSCIMDEIHNSYETVFIDNFLTCVIFRWMGMYLVKKLCYLIGDDCFQLNHVIVALWNILGLWPLVYCMLLIPSGRRYAYRLTFTEELIGVKDKLIAFCYGLSAHVILLDTLLSHQHKDPGVDGTKCSIKGDDYGKASFSFFKILKKRLEILGYGLGILRAFGLSDAMTLPSHLSLCQRSTLLYNCPKPTIVVLYQDNNDACHAKTYEVSLEDKVFVEGPWSQNNLDNGTDLLIPVPPPFCGVLIIGKEKIVYCSASALKQYQLELVIGLKFELLGETSIASTISYLDNAFVYVGSSYGDVPSQSK
ncbi:hypothetical protein L1887_43247 [Cichorium endivia]|nr:hypothetical protein L1887_43247 [Cichorium endivia]